MGTNYYWYPEPPCQCCGREFDEIHIGKSSGGWCFSLHVIPESGIKDLGDWVHLWHNDGSVIRNEYNEIITPEEMYKKITERSWNPSGKLTMDWYRENYAEPGPNNLARASIDNRHCIGHGEGTWDLIIGEFR
jgi:hypothetical protein